MSTSPEALAAARALAPEAVARALPCEKYSGLTGTCDARSRCHHCCLRPAVAAEMRALVERAVAEEQERAELSAWRECRTECGDSCAWDWTECRIVAAIRGRGEKETT